jgi:hypothetical protein
MRTIAEAAGRHWLTYFGMKDPFVSAEIQRQLAHETAMHRARLHLGEPPRPGESDAEYLARAEAALSYVPPEPAVECRNEAPVRGRFCVLPPGAVRWTERGWEAWQRDLDRHDAVARGRVDRLTAVRSQPAR